MTTATISTTSTDCDGNDVGFSGVSITLSFGGGAAGEMAYRAWIPFVVSIPRGAIVSSATLKLIGSNARWGNTCKIKVGCEAADNPSAPANWTQLYARTLTSSYLTDNNVGAYSVGTEYTYTITGAVQEILNRTGWVSGNTMAVLFVDNGSSENSGRLVASYDNPTYTEPILEIIYTLPSGVAVASLSDYGII